MSAIRIEPVFSPEQYIGHSPLSEYLEDTQKEVYAELAEVAFAMLSQHDREDYTKFPAGFIIHIDQLRTIGFPFLYSRRDVELPQK